jgi:hypothetical protein
MGISASARSASAGARRIDRRDRVERDHCAGIEPARRNGKVATLTIGLGHDVSTVLGIGRQLGSQARANTSITIMRAPQRGHGQGSTRRASGVISGCFCGSAGGRDDMEQCAGCRDVLSAVGVGKEPLCLPIMPSEHSADGDRRAK